MKIIPKKLKVKNTIFKEYSLLELIFILILLLISFLLLVNKHIVLGIIIIIFTVILFLPTSDGLVYFLIYDFFKYLFSKKKYIKDKNNTIKKLQYIESISNVGIIKYKNNTYSKVIKIGQKNFLLEDEENQELDIECINKALKQIENLSYIDIIKIDEPINFDKYINDLDNRILLEKNKTTYNTNISIKEKILHERKKYIESINNIKKQYIPSFYIVIYSDKLKELDLNVSNFIHEVRKSGIECNELDLYKTAIFLKYNYSRNFDEREVFKLKKEQIVEWIYPSNVIICSNKYLIDDNEASVLAIRDYPLKVKNGWASNIFNIDNTKVVMRIKKVDKYKAIKKIDKCILELESKEQIETSASIKNSSLIHKNSMYELLNNLQAENEQLLDVNLNITAYKNNSNSYYRKDVKRKINNEGFRTTTLLCNQLEGFLLSHCNNVNNKLLNYTNAINSNSLAACFPFTINHIMDEEGIVLGQSINKTYPFIFNIWKRKESYQNSNAFVIGKSGSGKTYFMKNLLINEWSNNTRIIICDPEAEYVNITKKLNGNIIDVGTSQSGKINPFHIYKIFDENSEEAPFSVMFNTHLKTLESFFKVVLQNVSNDILELINSLVIEAYEDKNINDKTNFNELKNTDFPIFSDLLFLLNKKINDDNIDSFLKEKYQNAQIHLLKFTSGRYSDIWNNPSTLEIDADIINFNFQSLFTSKNNTIANAQMLLIFRFIEQEIINKRKTNKNEKTMIVIDEAHMFIDHKYPIALDFFYQMNKRIRKYNGSFIPVTQNISDWNSSLDLRHKTSTIIKNSQYTFIFKSSSPDMQDLLDIYKAGNSFNKEERKIIISSSTGQVFFIASQDLRFPVQIKMNDEISKLF